jgi:hypothetical protein
MRISLFWVVTQRVMAISYRSFGKAIGLLLLLFFFLFFFCVSFGPLNNYLP